MTTLATLQKELRTSHAYDVGRSQAIGALRGSWHDCQPRTPDEVLAFRLSVMTQAVRIANVLPPLVQAIAQGHEAATNGRALRDLLGKGLGEVRALRLFARLYRGGRAC